jgi:hypothetical protein
MRDKFAELDTEPLFAEPPRAPAGETSRTKPPRTVFRRQCPRCRKEVGVIVAEVTAGGRKIHRFRLHWRRTEGGIVFECLGSREDVEP